MPERQVRRRRVFYIPGYDPFPARRYRELYRREGRAQAEFSKYEITQFPRKGENVGWRVKARIENADVATAVEVLGWSDIVRGSMSQSIPATYWQLAKTSWTYLSSGALRRLMWLRKGPVIAALYPIAVLLAQLLLGFAVFGLAGSALVWAIDSALGLFGWSFAYGAGLLWWAVALAGTALTLRVCHAHDNRFLAYYLMHDYAFSAQKGGANPPELEERMAEMGGAISRALATEVDEVLIVGHSSGAHLGVSILADLIRSGRVPEDGPALSFLTLGQVVPMVSFLPKAHRLRADLQFLSKTRRLTWVDVSAPGDGCSFALCDPVAVSGVQPPGARWPLVISAAFSQTLSPDRWNTLKRKYFRLHFQYLCAFDQPGDYDYFRITAGPRTLSQRFAGRQPSRQRIDVPASKHTSIAA